MEKYHKNFGRNKNQKTWALNMKREKTIAENVLYRLQYVNILQFTSPRTILQHFIVFLHIIGSLLLHPGSMCLIVEIPHSTSVCLQLLWTILFIFIPFYMCISFFFNFVQPLLLNRYHDLLFFAIFDCHLFKHDRTTIVNPTLECIIKLYHCRNCTSITTIQFMRYYSQYWNCSL